MRMIIIKMALRRIWADALRTVHVYTRQLTQDLVRLAESKSMLIKRYDFARVFVSFQLHDALVITYGESIS